MGSSRNIFFIRHGQSTANAGGLSVESKKVPLTDKGELQAQLLAENFLHVPSEVIVSEFCRAQQTAAPYCAKHEQKSRIEPLTNEFETLSFELIEGLYGEQRRQLVETYWREMAPDGVTGPLAESFLNFAGRVKSFRVDILPQLPPNSVCFGHGMWFAMLVWQIMGYGWESFMAMKAFRRFHLGLPLPNAMIYELSGSDGHNWHIRYHGQLVMDILAKAEAKGNL